MEKTETNMDKRQKVYEVGYLLLPTIPEEHLATEVQNIKAVIEKQEGSFITEDFPKLRPLAYTMRKAVSGGYQKYDKAYFGWVKFEIDPSVVPAINKELEKNANLLRFMTINTVRENTMFTQKAMFRSTGEASATDADKPEEEKEKMSEEEMDKTIDNLVVE